MIINALNIDKNWTLFLDRDGVINKKLENDYVKNLSEFSFIEGSLEAISILSIFFSKILIVTNQRGVGKGIMSESDLQSIHFYMQDIISRNHGRIDEIICCTDPMDSSPCRKPNLGMAWEAKSKFPTIDFKKSIIVGDSLCDMQFGKKIGMVTVLIKNKHVDQEAVKISDSICGSLYDFATKFTNLEI